MANPSEGGNVSIQTLKEFVASRFPAGHPLRDVVLIEKDEMRPEEFLAKSEVWIALLNRRT